MEQEEIQKTTMTKLEIAANEFAFKNHSWLKDALPTLAAIKSFKEGAEWMRSETINKACEWLKRNFNMPDDFESHFRKAMEEQQ